MDCTPKALMAAATCYRGVAPGRQLEVQIYLLCQINNAGGVVQTRGQAEPESQQARAQAPPTDKTHAEV